MNLKGDVDGPNLKPKQNRNQSTWSKLHFIVLDPMQVIDGEFFRGTTLIVLDQMQVID